MGLINASLVMFVKLHGSLEPWPMAHDQATTSAKAHSGHCRLSGMTLLLSSTRGGSLAPCAPKT